MRDPFRRGEQPLALRAEGHGTSCGAHRASQAYPLEPHARRVHPFPSAIRPSLFPDGLPVEAVIPCRSGCRIRFAEAIRRMSWTPGQAFSFRLREAAPASILGGFRPLASRSFRSGARATTCPRGVIVAKGRNLLGVKSGKLGEFIARFDIPAVKTCPGSSSLCRHHCYADSGRYRTPVVKRRLAWSLRQAKSEDFVQRLTEEIRRRGVLVLRIHSGRRLLQRGVLQEVAGDHPVLPARPASSSTRGHGACRPSPPSSPRWRRRATRGSGTPATRRRASRRRSRPESGWRTCDTRQRPCRSGRTWCSASAGCGRCAYTLPMLACPQEIDKTVTCGSCQHCLR